MGKHVAIESADTIWREENAKRNWPKHWDAIVVPCENTKRLATVLSRIKPRPFSAFPFQGVHSEREYRAFNNVCLSCKEVW